MLTRWRGLVLFVGLALGVAASVYVPQVYASRNSSGTYSLPTGQPVISGTTISSTTFNSLTSDLATELTDSLDRSGKGAMLAPLQCTNGTVSAPSITFASDLDTGLYRLGANNPALAAGGIKVLECISTGCTFSLTSTHTGISTFSAAVTDNSTLNVVGATTTPGGLTSTKSGSGNSITATGGTSDGIGIYGIGGATNGRGGYFTGTGSGPGLEGLGGATGNGGTFSGGATSGTGVTATGGATSGTGVRGIGGTSNGVGGYFSGLGNAPGVLAAAGTDATATVNSDAIKTDNGALYLAGVNPNSDVSISNRLTPMNIPKAWARINPNGASATTIVAGFNVTNPQQVGNTITIDFQADFTATPACVVSQESATASNLISITSTTTSTITIQGYDVAGASGINLGASAAIILNVVCFGAN